MKSNLIENRHIRVFISSTFQDMQEERDYLMKKVFPKLRIIALKRNVTITEVDLRWGITKEESESGKVIEICLREIENSNPFFIGLIGNRYGWIPTKEEINENVFHVFNPVERYVEEGLSVTEMEIQYGVLERNLNPHAYFFIKQNQGTVNESLMLRKLKEKVINSEYPYYDYSTIEQLGEEVEGTFIQLLDLLYPVRDVSEREYQKMLNRANLRQLCLYFLHRDIYSEYLDKWSKNDKNKQLVIIGDKGAGKSALVSNWINKIDKTDDPSIVYLFINKLEKNPNKKNIINFLADEISSLFNLQLMNTDDSLSQIFAEVGFHKSRTLFIVIDGLNHINNDTDKSLNWIPKLPENIKIIYTTTNDDITFHTLKNKDINILEVQPLLRNDVVKFSNEYLRLFGKSLTIDQTNIISGNRLFSNPMILKSLLNELIKFGNFDNLNQRIELLADAKDSEDFYQQLLKFAEDDYSYDFVKQALSIIALSRRGLYENDILNIINNFSEIKYTPLLWSQLYNSFFDQFSSLNGIISFENTYLLKAINDRYLEDSNNKDWKELMAFYIWSYSKEILQQRDRSSDILLSYFLECAFQAVNINDSDAANILHKDFGNSPSLAVLSQKDEALSIKCLNLLKKSGYNIESYFYDKIDSGDYNTNVDMIMSLFHLADLLELDDVIKYLRLELNNYSRNMDNSNSKENAKIYCEIANSLSQGSADEFHKAFELYYKTIELLNDERCHTLSVAYNGLANLCIQTNQGIDVAEQLILKAIEINKDLFGEYHLDIAANYNNIARIFEKNGNIDQAKIYYLKSIDIIKIINGTNSPDQLLPLYNLSLMLFDCNEINLAKIIIEDALEIINKELNGIYNRINDFLELYRKVKEK